MPGAVVIGVGPGVGRAVARRFAAEGLPLALLARGESTLAAAAEALAPTGVPIATFQADAADRASLDAALDRALDRHGVPEVVVYNAALIRPDTLGELSVRGHLDAWAVNVVGAINAAARLAPPMADAGGGSFLITGGMPEPKPEYVSLSLGKAGVRTLVTLIDQQYGPSGVHAASVTIAGEVAPGTDFDPDDIAARYWDLHTQPRDRWQHEVVHTGRP
ncbi:SDR family NAD(P)-dependent oxidoreductase [Actinomadura gamaensis]|uniref:SDR family NAD(P)-dependent oxidoreductase n=1 Tax=Actinomadura gamaensis TaxID=1763541 RepID=A0ABV9TYM2_9ACTN